MTEFLFTFGIIALAMLGMAVGVIARGRSIRAGCGGSPAADDGDTGCEVCDGSSETAREPELAGGLRSSLP
ncbi:MAG: hypothetical protein V3R85_11405 [Alphaproteobacteria bacterium]